MPARAPLQQEKPSSGFISLSQLDEVKQQGRRTEAPQGAPRPYVRQIIPAEESIPFRETRPVDTAMEETSSQLHSNAPSWQDIKHVPATTEQEDLTNQANRLFGERQAFQPAAPEGPSKQRQGVLIEGNIGDVVHASTEDLSETSS